jgi:hypothetical protein
MSDTQPKKTPGQRAYEAWVAAQEHRLAAWEKLSARSKSVWERVAHAARHPEKS